MFEIYSNGKKVAESYFLSQLEEEEIGVFESLRTYGTRVFRQGEHLDRLFESAKTAGFAMPTRGSLEKELKLAVNAFRVVNPDKKKMDLFLRLTLMNKKIFVLVGEKKHSQELYESGVALKTSPIKRSLSNASAPEIKTSSYQNAVLATLEVAEPQTYEWIFLDRNGYVTEVRIGNLFIVTKDGLLTPPTLGILNGVTRRVVIECALQAGIKVKETFMTRHEIFNAQEAFLTNTSWEILPVRELDRRVIGKNIPGPITQKLQQTFRQKIKKEKL